MRINLIRAGVFYVGSQIEKGQDDGSNVVLPKSQNNDIRHAAEPQSIGLAQMHLTSFLRGVILQYPIVGNLSNKLKNINKN